MTPEFIDPTVNAPAYNPSEISNPEVWPAETRVSSARYFPVRRGLGAAALLLIAVALRWGVAPAFERQRFTPETIEAQVRLAKATRRWMRALEIWLPLASGVAGLILIAAGIRAWRESD